MKFSRLVEYLEQLENTSKRLEMFEILSSLFKETSKEEIDKVIYLLQEHILPSFEGVELGIAEKTVEKSISRVTAHSESETHKLYSKLGDLGLVAEQLIHKKSSLFKSKELQITDIYQQLLKIAEMSGGGSVDKKIAALSGILSNSSGKEARYIIRFVLGSLRLGIGDPTIMDSLSKSLTGERELRVEIERAYNLCSDLGYVAKRLWEKGAKVLKEFKVEVGKPIRMALAERLPSFSEIIKKIGKCAVETKYDGLRLQIHKDHDKVEIFSRNLERMTHMFPDIVNGIKKQLNAKTAILEGEALAFNEETSEFYPFQVTITRKRKHGIEEMAKDFPLVLFAFDLLYKDGKDMTPEGYEKRASELRKIIKKGNVIRESERIITDSAEKVEKFFEEQIERGAEGIIAKRLNAEYRAGGRNFNWIKLKRSYKGELQDTIDVVLIGYFKGRGMRAKFGIGAVLGAVYDKKSDTFKSIAKIGSGLSEEKWVEIRRLLDKSKSEKKPARIVSLIVPDVWSVPKYVFTVRADEITKSPLHTAGTSGKEGEVGLALRFPRIQNWIREDKKPEDSTSVKEVEDMFKVQRKVKAVNFGK